MFILGKVDVRRITYIHKSEHMTRASYNKVAEWVDKAWKNVTSVTIISRLMKASIIFEAEECVNVNSAESV